MKQYRLLRDNKETGPYAAEELIQMGLKKYDLVWVEGRSAAWRYPCEIDALKAYAPPVEEQPFDRFYKKPSTSSAQQPAVAVTTAETPVLTATETRKEKPRFRIKADSSKIETIVTTVVAPLVQQEPPTQPQSFSYNTYSVEPAKQSQPISYNTYSEPVKQSQAAQTNATPAWENMWLDWEKEKKAVSDASVSYQTVNDRIKHIGEEEILETKFSQSLDDIAGQYADSLLAKKKSSGNFDKYKSHLTAAVLLIAILAAGMWVGLKWSDKTGYTEARNNQPQQDIQLIPNEEQPLADNSDQNNDAVIDNTPKQEENTELSLPVENKKQSIVTPAVTRNTKPSVTAQQKNNIAVKKTSTNTQNINTVAKNNIPVVPSVQKNYQPSVTEANGARSSVKRNDVSTNTVNEPINNQPVANNEVKREVKKAALIDDYIDVESYPVSSGVQYNLSNISDVPLDLVVLDLQYFDAKGKYLKGETLTVENIEAGGSIKINAPENAKAAGIKYKVSMISSAQNDLNIIAD
jgi:hypothetical protein